jgi:hypothetical protein
LSYQKIDSGSEPSSYTWAFDKQTTAEGGMVAYSGVDTTNPIDASADNSGLGTSATTTPISTTTASDTVVALFAVDEGKANVNGSYFGAVTGMTEKTGSDVSNTPFGPSIAIDEAVQASTGAFTSKSSAIGGNNKSKNWATQVIALRTASTDIAFDSAAYGGINAASSSLPITRGTSASNYVGLAMIEGNCPVTGVTWGGSAMTQLFYVTGALTGGDDRLYYIVNPPSGTQTVNVAVTGSCGLEVMSYANVDQSSPFDTNLDGSSNSFVEYHNGSVSNGSDVTLTGTTHIDRSLGVLIDSANSVSAGSNTVERIPDGVYEAANVKSPAGSVSVSIHNNWPGTSAIDGYLVALQPAN